MRPLITPATDVINMSDWLELRALLAADRNASRSDLRRALTQSGVLTEAGETGERLDDEVLANDTFYELNDRASSAGPAYPFLLEDNIIQTKNDITPFWPYVFCLLLSIQGASGSGPGKRPTEIFEEVAEKAAGQYVGGRSARFGFPRRVLPSGFIAALDSLCSEMGEGLGGKQRPRVKHAKDARLDIVAWRPFLDRRSAQMILFGQCATGSNWRAKLTELQPEAFTDIYWKEPPAVRPLKAFFTPFRIQIDRWYEDAKLAGIIFDRCRVASFAHDQNPPNGLIRWNTEQLRKLGA